ncbi:SDR family NAD(P)-dependent oxidoreductase [Parahaliea mediterranea]|uniref:SDR family NAD(P)-dependent oxidoreductase n=1 Tax=Parahaliea mediterranea TaxID=651086 RepID=UPI000E2E64F1|nr:SDR family oxidoreductase [Parahaliea mediterranea]
MHERKISIVTGAAAGIGEAVARTFAREGWVVMVADINTEDGERVAGEVTALGGEGHFVHTDITQLDSVQALVAQTLARFERVDVLVNNAYPTGSPLLPTQDIVRERMQRSLTAGFAAVHEAMQAVYPAMARQQWGRIINMCSLNGVNAHAGTVDYNCAKEAVRALTRTAAVEWGRDGITVNAVCPGAATSAYKVMQERAPQMIEQINQLIPMGYSGDPERDIAPVVLFLAGEGARYMTGNTLFVDGGGHINGVPWKP